MSTDLRELRPVPHVALLEIARPPNNFIDAALVRELADALQRLDGEAEVRAVVLASEGRCFCAGSNLAARKPGDAAPGVNALYEQAVRLFESEKPIVAAIQGPAIGGGLGLTLVADFRVASPEARLSANFSRLGYYPGFGLTTLLPRLVGVQHAAHLLYSGCRLDGDQAQRIGLVDRVAPAGALRDAAIGWAAELAEAAPLSVRAIRRRLRRDLRDAVVAALQHEVAEQATLRATEDFREGVAATAERRPPRFQGR